MAAIATLTFAGKDYPVYACSYQFVQSTGESGSTVGDVQLSGITITLHASEDSTFYAHMIDPHKNEAGSIKFQNRGDNSTSKELKFTEAYVVAYQEEYQDYTTTEPLETFTLTAKTVEINGATYTAKWPGKGG